MQVANGLFGATVVNVVVIACALEPAVNRLPCKGLSRNQATALVLFGPLALYAGAGLLIRPRQG